MRLCAISERNSSRVSLRSRKPPSMALVTVPECCFSTPRIIMQKWRASHTTPTPSGFRTSWMHSATSCVNRSLHLQTPREHVDDSRDFAQSDHLFARDIGHVHLAEKGQQMMFAEAEEFDILDDHHLVILHAEERVVDDLLDILRVTAGEVFQCLVGALGRTQKAFPSRVLTEPSQDFGHKRGNRNLPCFWGHHLYDSFVCLHGKSPDLLA